MNEPTPYDPPEEPVEMSTQIREEMNAAVERYETEIDRIKQYKDAIETLEKAKTFLPYEGRKPIDEAIKTIHARFAKNYRELFNRFSNEKLVGHIVSSPGERILQARADYNDAAEQASQLMQDPEANAAIHQAALDEDEARNH